MVTVRDIPADFLENPKLDIEKPRKVHSLLGDAMWYCEKLDELNKEKESAEDFKQDIKFYWTEEMIRHLIAQHSKDVKTRKANIDAKIEELETYMDRSFERTRDLNDVMLVRVGDSLGAGIFLGEDDGVGRYQSYHTTQKHCAMLLSKTPILRLRRVPVMMEGLPAMVAQGARWSVGFPHMQDDVLIMTPDLGGSRYASFYKPPFMTVGLVPVRKVEPYLSGPYR